METPLLGFSHVQLRVDDVAASRDWYTTVLGVEQLTASDDLSYVALQHKPSHLVIVLSPRNPALDDRVPTEPLDHLAFAVRDGEILQAWADHLTAAGIDHPGVVLELGKPSLQLLDPDGITIELVAPAPRRSAPSPTA
jgi:glyoxylase I family protein